MTVTAWLVALSVILSIHLCRGFVQFWTARKACREAWVEEQRRVGRLAAKNDKSQEDTQPAKPTKDGNDQILGPIEEGGQQKKVYKVRAGVARSVGGASTTNPLGRF